MNMGRVRMTGLLVGGVTALSLTTVMAAAGPAGASGVSVKVSPSKGLADGKVVTVSGTGLPATTAGKKNSFFIDECNAAVTGQLSVADEPHCDVSLAKALTVSKKGTFKTSFKVATGTVGDGTCGVAGHLTCVIGVGDAGGQGGVANITFK
jgi:Neocarzinostatin family